MNTKHCLIILTETERSMVEEALSQSISNPFQYVHVSEKKVEQSKKENADFLNMIKEFNGGFRKVVSDYQLHMVCEALWWYAAFISVDKDYMNDYKRLSTILRVRSQNKELFDFDPQNYNPKEYKNIKRQDFSKERFLIARENNGQINYISEIIQEKNETPQKYKLRAELVLKERIEDNNTGKWLLITNNNFNQYKYSEEVRYFYQKS